LLIVAADLGSVFRGRVREFLALPSGIHADWDACDRAHRRGGKPASPAPYFCCVRIPAKSDDGFEVEIHAETDYVEVFCAPKLLKGHFLARFPVVALVVADEHAASSDVPYGYAVTSDVSEAVERALGEVGWLLSPYMRLRVRYSNDRPYLLVVEFQAAGAQWWQGISRTGMYWFNYFGTRSERIFTNHHLYKVSEHTRGSPRHKRIVSSL